MKNTNTLEHAHIRDLLKQDNKNLSIVNNCYEQAMEIVNSHLNRFYRQYATDTGLNLTQVQTMASNWDIQQYLQAIHEIMNYPIANQQLSSRLQQAFASASQSKESLMGAMLQAGLAVGTAKVQQYGDIELPKQYVREFNYRSPQNITTNDVPTETGREADFNHRIWSHNDEMVRRAQSQLHKSIQKGLNGNSISRLTNTQPESHKRLSNNLSSQANSMVSRVQLVFKVHSIKNTEQGKHDAYGQYDTDNNYIKWITQQDSRVCPLCSSMDGNIYPENDAPEPEIDTHLGCRCQDIECDKDGNLTEVFP